MTISVFPDPNDGLESCITTRKVQNIHIQNYNYNYKFKIYGIKGIQGSPVQKEIKLQQMHTNGPERIHSNRRLPLPSPGTFIPMSTSLFGMLPSGENGNRQGIIQNNPVTRKLQRKRPSTNQLIFQGKRCRYDFPFSCPTKGTSPLKGGSFLPRTGRYKRPTGSTDHTGLRNRTAKPSSANQPTSPPLYCLYHRRTGGTNKPPTKRGDHRSCF